MATELTVAQRMLLVVYGRMKDSSVRKEIIDECRAALKEEAEKLVEKLAAERPPPAVTDIQVYEHSPVVPDTLWVRYSYSDGTVKKYPVNRPLGDAIREAWTAGLRVGSLQMGS